MFTSILQPTHLLIILIVALVFLGPKRLPEAGRALGEGLRQFKSSISGDHEPDPPLAASTGAAPEESLPRADPQR